MLPIHIYLDTQFFFKNQFKVDGKWLMLLLNQINEGNLVLHSTDITLMECKRHIINFAEVTYKSVNDANKTLSKKHGIHPSIYPNIKLSFDKDNVAKNHFSNFKKFIITDCKAQMHLATKVEAKIVFSKYFNKKGTFSAENSKEFPDAFILESLKSWSLDSNNNIYVVTEDKLFSKAAKEEGLNVVANLAKIMDIINIHVKFVNDLKNDAHGLLYLEKIIESEINNFNYIYNGIYDAEVLEAEFVKINWIEDITVSNNNLNTYELIYSLNAKIKLYFQYEDPSTGFYDNEEGKYYFREYLNDEIIDDYELELIININYLDNKIEYIGYSIDNIDVNVYHHEDD